MLRFVVCPPSNSLVCGIVETNHRVQKATEKPDGYAGWSSLRVVNGSCCSDLSHDMAMMSRKTPYCLNHSSVINEPLDTKLVFNCNSSLQYLIMSPNMSFLRNGCVRHTSTRSTQLQLTGCIELISVKEMTYLSTGEIDLLHPTFFKQSQPTYCFIQRHHRLGGVLMKAETAGVVARPEKVIVHTEGNGVL